MNFQHTEDRRMLADTLDRYLREQYTFEVRQQIAGSALGASRPTWDKLVELGALAALFTEDQGGMGGAGFDIAVVFESLGRGLVVEPLLGALMAGQALLACGDARAGDAVAALIGGEQVLLLAHEEGDTGAEIGQVACTATRTPQGWQLGGSKVVVQQADFADAFVVSARSSGEVGEEAGLSLFLLPADWPGLQRQGYALIDGGRGAELVLDGVCLPADALWGQAGQAGPALARAVACGLLALSAESLGAMACANTATLDYLRTRQQFGVPIGSFQALQHRMADVLLEVEQARSAVINAAAALDSERRVCERAVSAAKYTVGRVGVKVAEESIQLHGGIGMTWELPLAHYAKRLVLIDHQLGDEDQHLARFIALGAEA